MTRPRIRVALVGVGNCASSFVQGLQYYCNANAHETVPGLMNVELGGYHVGDIEVVAAFDISAHKVGQDVARAILAAPNNTHIFATVPPRGIIVQRGPTMDGLGKYMRDDIEESSAVAVDVVAALKHTGAEILVSYLPVGSQQA